MSDKQNGLDHFPKRFIERMEGILGQKQAKAFFAVCETPLPKTFRHLWGDLPETFTQNPIQTLTNTYRWEKTAIRNVNDEKITFGHTPQHFVGQMYSQSLSSMIPAMVLQKHYEKVDEEGMSGLKVLDMCAAPGSKTLQLSHMVGKTGLVVANEISSSRSKKLAANVIRCGGRNVSIMQSDGTKIPNFLGQEFDVVLLDAPCSSEGFARRSPRYLRENWKEKYIYSCANLQKGLIVAGFRLLAPGGAMLYSTCTTAPEENEEVVAHLQEKFGDAVELVSVRLPKDLPFARGVLEFEGKSYPKEISEKVARFYPHLKNKTWDSECFFVSLIVKKYAISQRAPVKKMIKNPIEKLKKNAEAEIKTRMAKMFGLEKNWSGKLKMYKKENEIWLASDRAITHAQKNSVKRTGLKLLDAYGAPQTNFAWHWGHNARKNVIEVDEKQATAYRKGQDLPLDENIGAQDGDFLIIRHKGLGLGIGKVFKQGKWIKNRLERGWRLV